MATEHPPRPNWNFHWRAPHCQPSPDTTARMTAGVLEALKDTDLVKRKPGRPKKQPQPQPEEEDDTLPPQNSWPLRTTMNRSQRRKTNRTTCRRHGSCR